MFKPQPESSRGAFQLIGTGTHQIRECRRALFALWEAVDLCAEQDVRDDVAAALDYLERHCTRRAPVLQFRRALDTQDPVQRWRQCRALLGDIGRAIPRHTIDYG